METMLSESLRVPYRAEDAIGTILVGSVLTLLTGVLLGVWGGLLLISLPAALVFIPIAVFPSLILRGYLIAVVDTGIHDQSTVPSFVRWGTLVKTGSKSAVVSVVYLLPAAVLCGLAVGGGVATVVSPPGFEGVLQALTGVVIMLSGFGLLIYGLAYLYVRPAARAVFAASGSLRTALGIRRVLRLASTDGYLSGWLVAMGLLVVGPAVLLPVLAIAVALGVLSPVAAFVGVLATLLLGIVLQFVFRLSAAWATGRGSANGLGLVGLLDSGASASTPVDTTATDTAPESVSEPVPDANSHIPEATPDVQVGRTIQPPVSTETKSQSVAATARTDGEKQTNTTRQQADVDQETDTRQQADVDQETNESGFVWGTEDDP
jgi:hypothetical protein